MREFTLKDQPLLRLTPISFLQTFVTQSIKLAGQKECGQHEDSFNFVQYLGLTASSCFEVASREQLGYVNPITLDQYAYIIINIKNQIGGGFSRISSEMGEIRVENTQCPFGDMVKEAPELCQMTSSVFGGIAARNFGYAKVELSKRIATGDNRCEVCIHTDAESARDKFGDEYISKDDVVISKSVCTEVSMRVSEKIEKAWCQSGSSESNKCQTPNIIATSQEMREILETAEVVAPTMVSVLIGGETGVGKEIIARVIHAMSDRSQHKFIAVNCGAIPENLIESMLFGHEKGAFTGAYNVHQGFFERAGNGTLFLDEIDSLPVSAQAKLLRVLQDGEFERVGGRQMIHADVRIIAASNRSIEDMVLLGDFRRDLFYRLNVVPIYIPPLRERREDITELVNHILRQLSSKYQRPRKILGNRAWNSVMTSDWPGNVRELENVLERAFLFTHGQVIEDIDVNIRGTSIDLKDSAGGKLSNIRKKVVHEIETRLLHDALIRFSGNVSAVARELGITPRAVHQKLKNHNIQAASYRKKQHIPL